MKWTALLVLMMSGQAFASSSQLLHAGWKIQNSEIVMAGGATVSNSTFDDRTWTSAVVPSTILGNLAAPLLGGVDDPFIGMNWLKLPGSGAYYPRGKNYGEIVTPPESPFGHPWWYRTSFSISRSRAAEFADLYLKGITYGAEIWLNGQLLAPSSATRGTYRQFRYDITRQLKTGVNTLAVLVSPPLPTDLTASWVDWNVTPQDKNMGLWREVSVAFHGAVSVSRSMVVTDLPDARTAKLTISSWVRNSSAHGLSGILRAETLGHVLTMPVTLNAGEAREVIFAPVSVLGPKLWWPWQMGAANLNPLKVSFQIGQTLSDTSVTSYGIRKIESKLTPEGSRLFSVNGQPIFIRGGGWSSNLMLRFDEDRQENELKYVRALGLNAIRLEGRFETEHLLDLADRDGLLVMPGWVCCNAWQNGTTWIPEHHEIARASLADQLFELRSHASVFVFLYGSDEVPPPDIEAAYLEAVNETRWPNPSLASASDRVSTVGSTGVKMTGPYAYTPPSYWYADEGQEFGGRWGFNTETSPGVSMPPMESLKEFIPVDHLSTVDDVWNFHMGENEFANLDAHRAAIERRYGAVANAIDFVKKSEVMDYDNHRAMFESYQSRKYRSATGVVQWMLNSSWPSLMWHLYDFYLRPNSAYYAVKKANSPVHVSLDPSTLTVSLLNSTYVKVSGLTVRARVLDLQSEVLAELTHPAWTEADSSVDVMILSEPEDEPVYFVRLDLSDSSGRVIDTNFYWLSPKKEIYKWDETDFKATPLEQEGDLSLLSTLPAAHVSSSVKIVGDHAVVHVSNDGDTLAFFVKMRLQSAGRDLLPVYWDDNNISLLPGEARDITVRAAGLKSPRVLIEGWNVH